MLRQVLLAAGCAALLTAPARADEANDIIDKGVKAHGGEDRLKKEKASQWDVKGTMNFMGMKVPYTAKYKVEQPGKFRFDMAAEFGGQKVEMAAATDGKAAWESAFGMTRDMEEKKAKAFHHNVYQMYLTSLLPLKDKKYTLTKVDGEKVDGKQTVGVKIAAEGKPDVTLYFDKDSGLMLRAATTIWDEFTDKEVPQTVDFVDYKEKDGVKQFNKLVISRDGKELLVEEMSDYKTVDAHDPKVFAKP